MPGYLFKAKKVSGSMSEKAVNFPVAFFLYVTSMPIGIHRKLLGILASATKPIAISTKLHTAIACTVLM